MLAFSQFWQNRELLTKCSVFGRGTKIFRFFEGEGSPSHPNFATSQAVYKYQPQTPRYATFMRFCARLFAYPK